MNNCGSCFTHRGSLTRHLRYECQQNPRFKCPSCDFRSRWTSDVYKHVRRKHQGTAVRCIDIGKNWKKNESFCNHKRPCVLCARSKNHIVYVFNYHQLNKNFVKQRSIHSALSRCIILQKLILSIYQNIFWNVLLKH